MRSSVNLVLLLSSLLLCQQSAAWEEGEDYDINLECNGLPKAGADSLLVRTRPHDGSFGPPSLVGIKDGKTLWSESFPKIDEVNTATLEVFCKNKKIKLGYRNPMSKFWVINEFTWDGKAIRFSKNIISENYNVLRK
jgi:hypothetical protein